MQFYLLIGGQRKGPLALEQLVAEGLERDTPAWCSGQADWVRADQVPALADLMLTIPPPAPPPPLSLTPPPPPEVFDERALAAWIRYRPGTFKTLHFWYVLLIIIALLLVVAGFVCLIVAELHRGSQIRVRDQFGGFRMVFDQNAWRLRNALEMLAVISFLAAAAFLLGALVFFYVLLYKAWNQIQDGYARVSAGQAVGFLFIPFFNLFWVFVGLYGLTWELHRYIVRHRLYGRHGLTPFPVSPGLGLACCIVLVCNVLPVLNFATAPVSLILLMVFLAGVRNASMGIATERLERPPGMPEPTFVPPSPPPVLPAPIRSEQVRRREAE